MLTIGGKSGTEDQEYDLWHDKIVREVITRGLDWTIDASIKVPEKLSEEEVKSLRSLVIHRKSQERLGIPSKPKFEITGEQRQNLLIYGIPEKDIEILHFSKNGRRM